MKPGLALLRRRDFGLLWTAGLISDTATGCCSSDCRSTCCR